MNKKNIALCIALMFFGADQSLIASCCSEICPDINVVSCEDQSIGSCCAIVRYKVTSRSCFHLCCSEGCYVLPLCCLRYCYKEEEKSQHDYTALHESADTFVNSVHDSENENSQLQRNNIAAELLVEQQNKLGTARGLLHQADQENDVTL